MVATIATLRKLNLYKCQRVTDAGLHALAPLAALQDLTVSGCGGDIPITDSGLRALTPLAALQVLRLDDLRQITDLGLSVLAAQLTELRALDVHGCASTKHVGHEYLRARGLQIGCYCRPGIEQSDLPQEYWPFRGTLDQRQSYSRVRWPFS